MNVVRSHPRPAELARLVPPPAAFRPLWKTAWPLLFWALWGAWLAVSDLRSDASLQGMLVRLIVGGALLGFARPRTWWLWSLALVAWVPAEPLVAAVLRFTPGAEWGTARGLLALPPALLGGLLGRSIALGVRAPGAS